VAVWSRWYFHVGLNFLEPECPFIIVNQLTEDVIEETIRAYAANDAYWLKSCALAVAISIDILNKVHFEQRQDLANFLNLWYYIIYEIFQISYIILLYNNIIIY